DFGISTSTNFNVIVLNNLNITSDDFSSIIFNNSATITSNISNFKVMMYNLDEVHKIINKKFEETKIFNQQNLANTTNLKVIKIRFEHFASLLAILLEFESDYY
ncbi:20812_t:CDS:2, partial [Cetraspora pellucida]